jgi:hypothetical protein
LQWPASGPNVREPRLEQRRRDLWLSRLTVERATSRHLAGPSATRSEPRGGSSPLIRLSRLGGPDRLAECEADDRPHRHVRDGVRDRPEQDAALPDPLAADDRERVATRIGLATAAAATIVPTTPERAAPATRCVEVGGAAMLTPLGSSRKDSIARFLCSGPVQPSDRPRTHFGASQPA